MSTNWYPLIFEPILKDRIWGGTKIKKILNKPIQSETIGESWEISTVTDNISIVKNGILKGKSICELIVDYPIEILGKTVYEQYGNQFPLLFKFLDADKDLSIQLHPNDELAKKRHNSLGKTEMWYVIQADIDSKIIVGFNEKSSPEEYLQNLEDKTLTKILKEIKVKEGDVFFIETGTIHAIGAGIVIAEIQQTSDITYRVYDWDRLDTNGEARELHIDYALDAINYNIVQAQMDYDKLINKSNKILTCPYFTTNFIPLEGSLKFEENGSSFRVFMCTNGEFEFEYGNYKEIYKKGDTILLPAIIKDFNLHGKASILEIYIS